jgi:hypothetical protein
MNLGKYSIKKNGYGELEDLEDIVSSYIMRLMSEENPTLIKYPSGYLKQALYYSQKPKKKYTKLLSDEEYLNPKGLVFKPVNSIKYSIEDKVLDRVETENTFECIYQIIDNYITDNELDEEEEEQLVGYIIDCLECGKYYKKYLYKINKRKTKDCFCECFELMEDILREEVEY